jgi:hypothetical protein
MACVQYVNGASLDSGALKLNCCFFSGRINNVVDRLERSWSTRRHPVARAASRATPARMGPAANMGHSPNLDQSTSNLLGKSWLNLSTIFRGAPNIKLAGDRFNPCLRSLAVERGRASDHYSLFIKSMATTHSGCRHVRGPHWLILSLRSRLRNVKANYRRR